MKYYSTVLNKLFDTVEQLQEAEAKKKEEEEKALAIQKEKEEQKKLLKAQREERAKEVEQAFKDVQKAQKKANELLTKFCDDYGTFHTSLNGSAFEDFFNVFWDLF